MAHKGENSGYFQDGRVRPGNSYALIVDEVLCSEALRSVPDYAVRVMLALAAKYRKSNNGDLSLTATEAQRYGIAEWKLRAGLAVLKHVGLIEVTRVGKVLNGKGVCSLYSLSWRQTDPSDKYDVPMVMAVRASNTWAKWTKPTNWDQQLAQFREAAKGKRPSWQQTTESAHLTRGVQAASHGGGERPKVRPTRGVREQRIPAPHGGVPSKNLGSPARVSALGQQLAELRLADCIALARRQPDLAAADLAARCRTDEATAHRALQQLQSEAAA